MKILRRCSSAILALIAMIGAFTLNFFSIKASSSSVIMYASEEKLNVIDFFKLSEKYAGKGFPEALMEYKTSMFTLFILFCITMLLLLAIVFISFIKDDAKYSKFVSVFSCAGLLSTMGMKIAFSSISQAVEKGTLTIGALAGSGILDSFAKLDSLVLAEAATFLLAMFAVLICLNAVMDVISKKKSK